MATKEKELKALEKIEKIVGKLGKESYVGAAFDGCFELAKINILNDFWHSMKQRAERAKEDHLESLDEVRKLQEELAESRKDCEDARAEVQRLLEQKNAEIEALREQKTADVEALIVFASERKAALEAELQNAAARIVENAGNPESAGFQNAVSDHCEVQKAHDRCTELLERISSFSDLVRRNEYAHS